METISDTSYGIVDNFDYAVDSHLAAAGEKPLTASIADLATKGINLTARSIGYSFANTAIDVANFFGANVERFDMETQIADNSDLLQYYQDHKLGIETAGLAIGSFAPGMLAVKVYKLATYGKIGANIAEATGIAPGLAQKTVQNALAEIKAGNAGFYGRITEDKFKAIALGFGEQALQAGVWEVATAATMHASPLLDELSFKDTVENMFYGVLVGGGIGGVLEGIGTRAIINKALVKQDVAEKGYELSTYLGRGDFLAGDRVTALLDSVEQIPAAVSEATSRKAKVTRDAAILNSRKILAEITGAEKDNAISNAFLDTVLRMKDEAGMGKEEMYDYLARLAKISRIDAIPELGDSTLFYVNRFAAADRRSIGWEDLVTNTAHEKADTSLSYRLKPFANKAEIARHSDEVSWEGNFAQLYTSPEDAWKAGKDMFIDAKMRIHVNPDAPNLERVPRRGESRILTLEEEKAYRKTGKLPEDARPLYGAPLILNVLDGSVKERAFAVVGDVARPEDVKLAFDSSGKNIGLSIGKDRISPQFLENGYLFDKLDTVDASARYIWAAKRGIKDGDVIHEFDIPMLEQLHRTLADETAFKKLNPKTIKLMKEDGTIYGIPTSTSGLEGQLKRSKDAVISKLVLEDNSINDAADVALRANVPVKYIESGLRGDITDAMIPVEQHMKVNHVKLEYDIGSTNVQDGQILRGMLDVQYRVQQVKDVLNTATVDFFKTEASNFIAKRTAADADILGAGATAFKFANAKYGSLAQEMETIGRSVTQKVQERRAIVSDKLNNYHQAILSDPAAGAELGVITNVLRKTGQRYVLLTPADMQNIVAKQGSSVIENGVLKADLTQYRMVLEKAVSRDESGAIVAWNSKFVPEGFIANAKQAGQQGEGKYASYVIGEKVAKYLQAHVSLNDARLADMNKFYAAQGINRSIQPGSIYVPPIDTSKYKFVALVRRRAGTGMADDEVAAITSDTASGLEQKAAALREEYDVIFKNDSKKFHEAQGDYEYNLNFAQVNIDAALNRKGILSEVFPETRGESILKAYTDWHYKQETRLVRNYTELANSQLFAELRALGERITSAETSKVGILPSAFGRTVDNPYNSYIKTALGISNREEYRLWNESNEKLEAFFDTAFRTAKQTFLAAKKGLISYEEASKLTERFGLGNPYERATSALVDSSKVYYNIANKLPPEKYLSRFVSGANSILSATAIRLDFFQSLINIVSTPVLLLAEARSAKKGVQELLTTELPDATGRRIPATSKLLYNAISNYFGKDKEALIELYRKLGAVRGLSSEYFKMIDELSLPISGLDSEKALTAKLGRAAEIGAKLTGSNFSEEFARFVAADVGRQIFEAAGHTGRDLTDNISTFVNRVHGNYIASQRPVAFQGPIGAAIGLFQTYQFNLLQQLFRYVENGEGKTLATLFGLQSTLFGMQSLPGFQAINSHIIGNAAGNSAHNDAYSIVPTLVDKKLGDYLLYGVMSNWLGTGLYSRGDINPRQITILPTNPLDYPAISGGIRFMSSVLDTAGKITNGGNVVNSILLGLEHNGLSRPLTGLAQLTQGYVTTSAGSLVSATRRPELTLTGMNDFFLAGQYGRLLGARPLDEAVTMDALYRKTLYQAKDSARIQDLGSTVRTRLYAGESLSSDELSNFAQKYANSGGHIENFGRKMIEWTRDSNASVANKVYQTLRDPKNQNIMRIMGGQPLPDFSNMPSTAAANTDVTGQ